MAARKSCTHLTWAEAKAKVGGSTGSKKPLIPKKIDHGKALTAKFIAKNGASQDDIAREKTLLKRAKRDEERAAAVALKRSTEREKERLERQVKPFDLAKERMIQLAKCKRDEVIETRKSDERSMDELQIVAECRELQLNEVLALEAIYADTGELLISDSSQLDILQQNIENWQMENENLSILQEIGHHPNISFTIQIIVDGICNDEDGNESYELAATLLLNVTLPSLYPLDESNACTPVFEVEYFMATDREAVCGPDKPLESLAHLDEGQLKNALMEAAKQILPDPCVYEVITTCLTEQLFNYLKLTVHGNLVFKQKRVAHT